MKYYVEERMRALRLALEDKVLTWPQVKATKMFGCPCYRAKGTLFAFLFMDSLVITRLSERDRERISDQRETMPFEAANRKIPSWLRIPTKDEGELIKLIPFVKKSYESALKAPKKR